MAGSPRATQDSRTRVFGGRCTHNPEQGAGSGLDRIGHRLDAAALGGNGLGVGLPRTDADAVPPASPAGTQAPSTASVPSPQDRPAPSDFSRAAQPARRTSRLTGWGLGPPVTRPSVPQETNGGQGRRGKTAAGRPQHLPSAESAPAHRPAHVRAPARRQDPARRWRRDRYSSPPSSVSRSARTMPSTP